MPPKRALPSTVVTEAPLRATAKTGPRTIPVTLPEAIEILHRRVDTTCTGLDRQCRILVGYRGRESALYHRAVMEALRNLDWKAVGVQRFTTRGIRRTAADTLRRAGVPIEDAAAILGHSPAVLMRTYRQVDEADKMEAMQRAQLGSRATAKVVSLAGRRQRNKS